MDTCVIKDKKSLLAVALASVAFLLVMYLHRDTRGLMIFVALCGLFVVLVTLGMTYTVTLTREQIICKSLFRPMTAVWDDVADVSVVSVISNWYIRITRKDKREVLIPYSDELTAAIIQYRGFLDRDDKNAY
jgi:hypothetical protein